MKIVITGTGRCGTSFIMQLLTNVGLNTGYTRAEAAESVKRLSGLNAGIEHAVGDDKIEAAEYIKNPQWIDIPGFQRLLQHHKVRKVLIPIRDLDATAKSRELMHKQTHGGYGGFWMGADSVESQNIVNALLLYRFIDYLATNEIKFKCISFSLMMKRPRYLYNKLGLGATEVDYYLFENEYKKLISPQK